MRSAMTLYGTGRSIPDADRVYWQLSALLCRRLYPPLKLYADPACAKRLTQDWKIPFDEVDTTTIPEATRGSHPMCWSAGKLAAMRSMAVAGKPFFHIDGDAFVFKRLPNEIETSPIFIQCAETKIQKRTAHFRRNTHYPINELLPLLRLPPWMARYAQKPYQTVMNMGIFGGNDCASIYEFANLSLQTFVRDRGNVCQLTRFHRSQPHFLGIACIAEQWSAAAYFDWKHIVPAEIMHRIDSFNLNRAHEVGSYLHLYTALRHRKPYRLWAKHKLRELMNEESLAKAA